MKRAAIPLLLLAIGGCGGSSSSSSGGSAATSSTTGSASASTGAPPSGKGRLKVTIKTLAFNPDTVTARVGQTVRWVNLDGPLHNVTYVSGPLFKSSPNMKTGQKFSLKVTKPGTIEYICTIHPFMKASIVVQK